MGLKAQAATFRAHPQSAGISRAMAPCTVASIASGLLVVVGIFRGGAALEIDVAKLKAGAKTLIVDGTDTGTGFPYLSSIDSIDRQLKISVNLPATEFPGTSDTLNTSDTCGRNWKCDSLNFDTCPGALMTTAMTRHFGVTPTTGYEIFTSQDRTGINKFAAAVSPYTKPTITWEATAGKFYTLLFVDLMSPSWPFPTFFHWGVYNIEGNDMTTGDESPNGYFASGNAYNVPNYYTFFLFQHDAKLTTVAAAEPNRTVQPFILDNYMAALGLQASQLVSVNWWKAKGSVFSFVQLNRLGASAFIPANACTCLTVGTSCDGGDAVNPGAGDGTAKNALDMCMPYDTVCADYAKTTSTTATPATTTTTRETITASKAPASLSSRAGVVLVAFAYLLWAQV